MTRTVTNHARDPRRRLVAINARRRWKRLRRLEPDTWMIVIKDERPRVIVVTRAVNAKVTRTEVTIRDVFRRRALVVFDRFAAPRTVLPVSGDDYLLLT